DAVAPRHFGGVREGIVQIALCRVGAEAEVEHADVEAVVRAVLHDPVDGGDDLGDVDGATRVGDLDVEQSSVGGQAVVLTVPGSVAAGDDPGDVGSVAIVVDIGVLRLRLRVKGDVGAVDDLARHGESGDRGDAGVDNGDVDALAGRRRCSGRRGVDGLCRARERTGVSARVPAAVSEVDGVVGSDGADAVAVLELVEVSRREVGDDAAE